METHFVLGKEIQLEWEDARIKHLFRFERHNLIRLIDSVITFNILLLFSISISGKLPTPFSPTIVNNDMSLTVLIGQLICQCDVN